MNEVITTLQAVQQYITSVPASTWYAVAVFIGSSAAVSTLVELLKRRYVTKHNVDMAKHLTATLLGFSSFLVSVAQGVIVYGTTNPSFLGDRTLEIVGFATLIYHFGLSKGFQKVATTLSNWIANGKAYNTELATGVPQYATTQPVADDHSQDSIL